MSRQVAPVYSLLTERQAATKRIADFREQAERFRSLADHAERELAGLKSTFGPFPASGQTPQLSSADEHAALHTQAAITAERLLRDAEHAFFVMFGTPPSDPDPDPNTDACAYHSRDGPEHQSSHGEPR